MRFFLLLFLSLYATATLQGAICFPGENLWRLTSDTCSFVETSSSSIEDIATSVYELLVDIDLEIQTAAESTLEMVSSFAEEIGSVLDVANSLTEELANAIIPISNELTSIIDAISMLENIDTIIVADNCSCIGVTMQSLSSAMISKIDGSQSSFDACCSSLSVFDTVIKSDLDSVSTMIDGIPTAIDACYTSISILDGIIKSDIDSFSTRVDGVASQASILKSDLDACCSVVDIIYECLVGVEITQAMVPYPITQPGSYELCQSVTATGAGTATITINASNVYLNLNGHAVASTDNIGIQCIGQSDVHVMNGTIMPSLQAFYSTGSSNLQLSNLAIINAASTAIDIESGSAVIIQNCTINGTNSNAVAPNAAVYLLNTAPAILTNVHVYNETVAGSSGFLISGAPNSTIVLNDCIADTITTNGFYVSQNTNAQSNVVFNNCAASGITSYGFRADATSTSFNGPLYRDCVASVVGTGFECNSFSNALYQNCLSDSNTTGFLFLNSTNVVCEGCIASNNTARGFQIDGSQGINTRPKLDSCLAINNGTDGIFIDSNTSACDVTDSIAGANGGSGINNASSTTDILDCRSQHAATSVNVAYQLNTNPDMVGGATIIITS